MKSQFFQIALLRIIFLSISMLSNINLIASDEHLFGVKKNRTTLSRGMGLQQALKSCKATHIRFMYHSTTYDWYRCMCKDEKDAVVYDLYFENTGLDIYLDSYLVNTSRDAQVGLIPIK